VIRDGWLHTGDMGCVDDDGFLFLSGRRSDMIKTGAHRVYPQDIESVIMEVPGVAEVAVVGVEDEVLCEAVKAVVVPVQGSAPDVQQIKAHCRAHLAMYKIPKVVEFRASLPRTGSGKVIRHALMQGNQYQ
jgi:acyl-CoA synthetase (AMP-forming)/AMP-acid ligase II